MVGTYKGQPEGKVGTKAWPSHASLAWGPETPPSPEAKRTEVPRAPSCAYALQRVLKKRSALKLMSCTLPDSLSQLGLLSESSLIETERGGEDKGRVVLLKESVDDVEEATKVAILVIIPNSDERCGDVCRHADGVLNVEALCELLLTSASHRNA